MELKKVSYPEPDEYYNKELISQSNAGVATICGTVFLKKGTRIPETGFSKHPFNEISIIIEGCIEMLSEEGHPIGKLEKGNAVYINAGEAQAGNVLEDTKIIYVLNQSQ
ncbi:hypothetical protein ACFSQJ_17455 [Croceitalea marina]|uniref:Cupin n=1 Tax=Croceitalea marina TaxID=1775166 RepID=A0ABW5N0P6_9FLAO